MRFIPILRFYRRPMSLTSVGLENTRSRRRLSAPYKRQKIDFEESTATITGLCLGILVFGHLNSLGFRHNYDLLFTVFYFYLKISFLFLNHEKRYRWIWWFMRKSEKIKIQRPFPYTHWEFKKNQNAGLESNQNLNPRYTNFPGLEIHSPYPPLLYIHSHPYTRLFFSFPSPYTFTFYPHFYSHFYPHYS